MGIMAAPPITLSQARKKKPVTSLLRLYMACTRMRKRRAVSPIEKGYSQPVRMPYVLQSPNGAAGNKKWGIRLMYIKEGIGE